MRAKIRDTELFFDIDGPALVPDGSRMRERHTAFLIHGGPGGDHTGFKVRFAALADKMQLVYFDHRGQGRSARGNSEKYTLDENVEDMEGLRRYLGLGPIVSIGYSYGGKVAMAHAARYPDSVSHLVLISTVAHSGYIARAKEIVAERGTVEQRELCEAVFAGHITTPEQLLHYYEVMGPLYARSFDWNAFKPAIERGIHSPDALNRAHGPGGFLRTFDLRPELGAITAPTLIMAGRHDWICPPEFSNELRALIPQSDLRIFEDSSHSIAADEPDKCLDAIAGFIVYNAKMKPGLSQVDRLDLNSGATSQSPHDLKHAPNSRAAPAR
jgi:proline iminopeptidase